MKKDRIIKRVGNYSTSQADQEDCKHCHNADYGTVIIDGLCVNCFEEKVIEKQLIAKILEMAVPSLSPEGWDHLEVALGELIKNRHIPIDTESYINEMGRAANTCSHCGGIEGEGEAGRCPLCGGP